MTLGHLLTEKKDLKAVQAKTTLFKSVGLALFDLEVSEMIYHKAAAKGLGTRVQL